MTAGAMIVLLCILASVVASLLVVFACVLSARISRVENLSEAYDDEVENAPQPQVARRSYSLEG